MGDQRERIYLAGRERASRVLAAKAAEPYIREIHTQLADAYAEQAQHVQSLPGTGER